MRNKVSNVLWGLFFIIIGVGFAGNALNIWDFHLFFDGWWTLFIIIPCFISMIQSGFGTGSTVGFIIGVMLLLNYQVDFRINFWGLVIPIILIFIGVRILFQGAFHKRVHINEGFTSGVEGQNYTNTVKPEYTAVFSSNRIHITEEFYKTSISAIFGSIVLDLRDAIINGDCEINVQAIFGGVDIFLPQNVKVKINNVPIFGGVSNKYSQYADPTAPTVYINSTSMFGGIDIK
jgi:predicted membrane protein